jgi:hypothetical protein
MGRPCTTATDRAAFREVRHIVRQIKKRICGKLLHGFRCVVSRFVLESFVTYLGIERATDLVGSIRQESLKSTQIQETNNTNNKEVKTAGFSPPGVGWGVTGQSLGGHAVLPCQAGLRPHSRMNCVKRLTTKGLAFGVL